MEVFNYRKAVWYWNALQYSDLSLKVVNKILCEIDERDKIVDIASGPGTVSIPLSYFFKEVISIDISKGMLKKQKEEMVYRNINNILLINDDWRSFVNYSENASLVIVMNFFGILRDPDFFTDECRKRKVKNVLIVRGIRDNDKFGWDSLKREMGRPLKNKKIADNVISEKMENLKVDEINYSFDQPFDSFDEAEEFWFEYLKPKNDRECNIIKNYIKENIKKRGDKLFGCVKSKAKLYWWKP